jgi:hypothetical protein
MQRYRADLAATLFVYVATSLLAGQVFRFPFDDEVYTLRLIEDRSLIKLLFFYPATNDVHPPLSYALFLVLHQLGLNESAMRVVSLAMTAAALLIFQLLALVWIERRAGREPVLSTRIVAVILFGLAPLAITYGDALRWYPLFGLLVALFAGAYFLPQRDSARLAAGVLLGLSASTSLLAVTVAAAFAAYRYGLERRFRWRFDLGFWLLTAGFGALGIYTAYGVFFLRPHIVKTQVTWAPVVSLPIDLLGFFGGEQLGIGQAWIVLPALVIVGAAVLSSIDREQPSSPFHFLLLLVVTAIALTLAGFAKPRSFLYLAPVVTAILVLYFDQQASREFYRRTVLMLACLTALSAATIGNLRSSAHPFKRELAIPYQEAIDFIEQNRTGRALVISTDPVVTWVLRGDSNDRCVRYFNEAERCLDSLQKYDSIFVVVGHSDKFSNDAAMRRFAALVSRATADRERRGVLAIGLDRDAALKSRLTGVHLDERLLRIDLYR